MPPRLVPDLAIASKEFKSSSPIDQTLILLTHCLNAIGIIRSKLMQEDELFEDRQQSNMVEEEEKE